MSGCKVDADASPQFAKLRTYWRKQGYRSVLSDLEDAFQELRQNVQACHWTFAQRTNSIVIAAAPERKLSLYKYRQKDADRRIGASGGWRFYAIFDHEARILYPIIVYPHKKWADAPDELIKECVDEIVEILKQRDPGSAGDIAASAE